MGALRDCPYSSFRRARAASRRCARPAACRCGGRRDRPPRSASPGCRRSRTPPAGGRSRPAPARRRCGSCRVRRQPEMQPLGQFVRRHRAGHEERAVGALDDAGLALPFRRKLADDRLQNVRRGDHAFEIAVLVVHQPDMHRGLAEQLDHVERIHAVRHDRRRAHHARGYRRARTRRPCRANPSPARRRSRRPPRRHRPAAACACSPPCGGGSSRHRRRCRSCRPRGAASSRRAPAGRRGGAPR